MKKRIATWMAAILLLSCAAAQAEPQEHAHKICGGTSGNCGHAVHGDVSHNMGDVTWVPWDGTVTNSYNWIPGKDRNNSGVYYLYLTDDIESSKTMLVAGGDKVYLCLNGHSIKKTASQTGSSDGGYSSKDAIIYVNGYLCLTDCQPEEQQGAITHVEGETGAGILCFGQMDMYGGSIANNNAGWVRGAGIHLSYADSRFRMYGGSLEGNTTSQYSGGAIWMDYGSAELYGGSIKQNHATDPQNGASYGGGVYVSENGSLIIGGSGAAVSGNTAGASGSKAVNNVYLESKKTIKLKAGFDAANSGPIGVTHADAPANPTDETRILFLEKDGGVTMEEVKRFVSDNPNYTTTVIDGKGYLVKGPLSYTITYDLDGGVLPNGKTNPATYTENETITLHNPEKAGYTFEGWTGTGLQGPTVTVTIEKGSWGNRTYVATWKAIPVDTVISSLPETGDSSSLLLWATLLCTAGGAMLLRRKKI